MMYSVDADDSIRFDSVHCVLDKTCSGPTDALVGEDELACILAGAGLFDLVVGKLSILSGETLPLSCLPVISHFSAGEGEAACW